MKTRPQEPFIADLARWGPDSVTVKPADPTTARRYCRALARRHYENFTVGSLLLPRRLRQHFYNLYAYCRWADDLADETASDEESLRLLDWWAEQLDALYHRQAGHPVFVALAETVRQFQIPRQPLADLLVAFRQDRRVSRYATRQQLLEYCRYSANPVGRLVLHLGKCHRQDLLPLADSLCTGLQLANFCQDVAEDWDRGRIYLPQEDCRQAGYDEAMFESRECNDAFRRLMAEEVRWAESYLQQGQSLALQMPRELRVDVALFAAAGLATLEAIQRVDYDVWQRRPQLTKPRQLALLARCWWNASRSEE